VRALPIAALLAVLGVTPAIATFDEGVALMRQGEIPEAYQVLRKAALGGDARAARALGNMLERDIMLPRNRMVQARPEDAAGWFLHAFERGDKVSADALGVLYYQGRGVARSIEESLRWFGHNHSIKAVRERFARFPDKDRDEVAAWWLAVQVVTRREVRFPRGAAYSNSWGFVEVRIDASTSTAQVARSDTITSIQQAATSAVQEALRQAPPPPAAIEAKVQELMPFDFRLLGPGEK
jgi:hypothetical protein